MEKNQINEFLKTFYDDVKGVPGYTPVKGKDYFTEDEIAEFKAGVTPEKYKDYFTEEEVNYIIQSIRKLLKDGKDGESIKGDRGTDGKDGRDGIDGSPDQPKDIANKLNTLKGEVSYKVLKDTPKELTVEDVLKEIKNPKSKNRLEMRDIKNMPLDMSDMRWHGGGLSKVAHDATLTGDGTDASPLKAVAGGSGDVVGPAGATADDIAVYNGATGKIIKDSGTKIADIQPKLDCVSKTTNYTAQPFELVNCDVSAASFKVTLPSAPADKTVIWVKLNGIGANKYLTLATSGSDKFNTATGTVEIYMYLFGEFAQCQYCSTTGLWTTFISAGTFNFATNFPGIDATTPITNADISINTTTRVLSIVPPLGYFNIFTDGGGIIIRYRKVGTISFPAFTDTSGTWFFYFDSTGTAVTTQTAWTGADFASIAPIYRLVWNKELFKFTVTAATATLGDTYTNNSSTFTVMETIAGGTTLICQRTTGTNNPAASGNLVRATGAGTDPIVFSAWDSSVKDVAEYIEYHLNTIPADTHRWEHAQSGTIWMNGLAISNNAISSGTPAVDGSNAVVALSTGTNADENLYYTITNSAAATPWTQVLGELTPASLNATNSALFKVFSQDAGGLLSFLPATRFPFAWNAATNLPQYINGTGVRATPGAGNFFVYFIYSTQNPVTGEAIKTISATTDFNTLALAQAYTWTNIQAQYPMISNDNEIRPLYRLIYLYNTGYNVGTKKSVLREVVDIRKTVVSAVPASAGSIPATSVTVTPAGNIAATNVQSALEELDNEKVPLSKVVVSTALLAEQATGFTLAGGTTSKTLTVALDANVAGTNTGDNAANSSSLALAGGTMTGKIVSSGSSEVGKTYTPATGAQTVALDCALNNIHIVTGHGSGTAITFTVANATNSQVFIVSILQGAVVSTITGWFATIRWAGGSAPTLTATINKRDTFGFIRTGADTYDGFIIGQNC